MDTIIFIDYQLLQVHGLKCYYHSNCSNVGRMLLEVYVEFVWL